MKHLIFNQFNLIKIFCCFLVVYQHIVGRFLNSQNATISTHLIYGTLLNFSRFAVPIFLFITGFVIMKSYENLTLKDFYKKKFTRILYIYIGANLLFITPRFIQPEYSINLFIQDFIFGKASSHLWYLNALIKIYLCYPIFKLIVLKLNKLLGSSAIIFITIIQYFISNNAYSILSKSQTTLGITLFTYLDRSLLLWGYYIILGGLIYKNFDYIYKLTQRYKKLFMSLYAISFIYINLYTFNRFNFTSVNYYRTSPSSFRVLIYSLLSIIVLYYLADYLLNKHTLRTSSLIKTYSSQILNVYITHPIIIRISSSFMFLIQPLSHNLGALIIILLVMITSILPFYIYPKLKKVKMIKSN
ncbi:MAG: acyltransferase [Sarcina sp.]